MNLIEVNDIWIVSVIRNLTHVFQDFNFFEILDRSLECPLHIASYALRIGISVMEL